MAPNGSEGFVVPNTYDELYRQYGRHIQKLLSRYNKVEANYQDLHSYVWVKIIEARLLERFEEYVDRQLPRVVSALEACDVLGVSWQQWTTAMSMWHRQGRGGWMPTPINLAQFRAKGQLGITSKLALFDFGEVVKITLEDKCAFRQRGRQIDEHGQIVAETRPEGDVKFPCVKVTASQFKNYLSMAVLNHYANFCRTSKRRHKERPLAHRDPYEEDSPPWESSIPDTKHSSAEVECQVAEVRGRLLLALGKSLGPLATLELHQTEIISRLTEGASLVQAVKDSSLPSHVRKDVVRAIEVELRPQPLELLSVGSGDESTRLTDRRFEQAT